MIKKKGYTAPSIDVCEVEVTGMLMSVSLEGNAGVGHGGGTVAEQDDASSLISSTPSYLD